MEILEHGSVMNLLLCPATKFRDLPEDVRQNLSHDLLQFLFSFSTEFVVCRRIEISELDLENLKVSARGYGEKFDLKKHPQGTEIKAITMHQMKVLTPTTVATEEGTAPRVPLLKLMIEGLSKQVTSHQKVATPPLVSIYYPKDAVESDQKEEHTENLEEQRDSSPKFPEAAWVVVRRRESVLIVVVILREPEPNLPEPPVEPQGGDDNDSPSFWHRAVRQLYEVYFQGRWHEIFQWLQPLPVSHWRQLLDFGADFRCFTFIRSYSYPPPAVPLQLLQHLAQVLLLRREPSRVPSQTKTTPLLYLYLALLLRSLCLPSEQSQKSQSAAPAKPVQFAVRLAGWLSWNRLHCLATIAPLVNPKGAPSMAALLQCYGAAEDKGWWQNFKSAWELRGHEVLAECQALLAELYPDHPKTTVEAPERTKPPCLASLLTTAALQFSIQNLQSSPSQERNGNSSTSSRLATDSRALYHVPEPDSGWCLNGSEGMLFAQVLQSCSVTTGSTSVASERFLRCFMDVLALSPVPISPTSEANGEIEIGEAPEALEIRNFSRLLRVLLQAYFIDPTLLAAEAPREALAAGAFAGPSDPDEPLVIERW
eukprot:symbB.v1.2.010543.t1/scaffold694.1/size172116/6